MNEVRLAIVDPEKVTGESAKINRMTRAMLNGKDFGKAAAFCAKLTAPMVLLLAVVVIAL